MRANRTASLVLAFLWLLLPSHVYCWNALGHRLVAQIAYNHLTESSKLICNHYNRALDKVFRKQNVVNSAAWLDSLYYQGDLWLKTKHYINLPFSVDGTRLIAPAKMNAITAIEQANRVLANQLTSNFDKGFSLRILLHVVGDIHQPLHAVSRYSAAYPRGDKGGNLMRLANNPISTNLHTYWDKGGGYLIKKSPFSQAQLSQKANEIEKLWPCQLDKMNLNPKQWAEESHRIAVTQAYQFNVGQQPSLKYQQMVKRTTEQRIALAGCRLAALLNKSLQQVSIETM